MLVKKRRTPARDRPKARPSGSSDIHEPARFMAFVEALEICRGLVSSGSPVPIRLAMVILDNIAEVLMLHKCSAILERDSFVSRIVSPEYSGDDRARVAADFSGKVWFLSAKVKLLSTEDATILRIGHSYRNAGFHRDEHNDDANKVIVCLLFGVTCRVLTVAYGDGTISGGDEAVVRWLQQYGIDAPYLDYGPASRSIGPRLLEGIEVTAERLREALTSDLDRRWQALHKSVTSAFPWPEVVLDEILKSEVFDRQYDAEAGASGRYRQMLRFIGQGGQPSRSLYRRREREHVRSVRSAYDAFSSPVTWRDVQDLRMKVSRVRRQRSDSRAFATYEELSDRLAQAEHLLASAIRKSEAAAEMAAEIAMGK